jgi:molybdate transport system ATP-binding protein
MTLSVSIRHAWPGFDLSCSFESGGGLTALYGPSGCGKSTIVNIIAGLIRPQAAKVICGGEVLADTDKRIWLPAHHRRIGYVFQDARLLPHFSVRQNLRYGRWFTEQDRRYAREDQIVELLGLSDLLNRKPKQLSGGEKQRVALGRALLQSPRLLLMDEPLASLDVQRKQEILPYIERLRDVSKVPIVYVSHAIEEVTRLATDAVLMSRGKVIEFGPLDRVMSVLPLIGDDAARDGGTVLECKVESYHTIDGLTMLSSAAGPIRLPGQLGETGSAVRLHVKATDVTLATVKPKGLSALNIFSGIVERVEDVGGTAVTVHVRCQDANFPARVTRYSARMLELLSGRQVFVIIKAMAVRPSAAPVIGSKDTR